MASSEETTDAGKLDASYLKKLDMSTEELGRFEKAMADPKFVQLLSDYAKEMEDPKLREENEQYLRQLEREGQGGASYGKNTELVAPHVGFCVKTKNKNTGAKAFINICHSAKIAAATSTVRSDGTGSDWSIPYSLSTARTEKDKAGKECEAHDFVIGSTTFERCQVDRRFNIFVVETALDSVEAQRQCRLDRNFTLPKLKFKGPGNSPPVLAVKTSTKSADEVTPRDSPTSPLQPSKHLNSAGSAFTFDRATKGPVRKASALAKLGGAQPVKVDSTLLGLEKQEDSGEEAVIGGPVLTEAAPADKKLIELAPASKQGAGLETQPKFDIVQQGVMDLSSFWLDERAEAPRTSRPESLLFRVELPLLASAATVDLDVLEQRVVLTATGKYHLDVALPFPVEESKGRAKFDKVRRRLEVVLPVVRPPMPPKKPFEEPQPVEEEETTRDDCREPQQAPLATYEAVPAAFKSPEIAQDDVPKAIMGAIEKHDFDPSAKTRFGMSQTELLNATEPLEPTNMEETGANETTDPQGSPALDTVAHTAPGNRSQDNSSVAFGKDGFLFQKPVVAETNKCSFVESKANETNGAESVTADQNVDAVATVQGVIMDSKELQVRTPAAARAARKVEKPRVVPKLTCSLAYDID